MQATAIAQPNIALIKYWGKRDVARNLPAVGSISITLRELYTEVSVELTGDTGTDLLVVNGTENTAMLPRISACLDNVIGRKRQRALVTSASNFPIAAGLASSASAFAAVTVAAAAAAELDRSTDELSRLAGFAELENTGDSISVRTLLDTEAWPLQVVVAITETGAKPTGSTEAMEISRQSSPFYSSWVQQQQHDLDVARSAILQRDFDELATIAEHNCLKMHSVMWASRPPMVYWNSATMRCMQTVRELQQQGHKVFFTIDAGPQLKAVCLPDEVDIVAEALAQTDGVREIMRSGLGAAARLIT
jgi:diphosphomevalonate decarboxylase